MTNGIIPINSVTSKNNRKRFKSKIINARKSKKVKAIAIIIVSMLTMKTLLDIVNPIYEKVGMESAKSLGVIITNEESTNVMKKHTYNTMFSIEKDNNGNITMIKSNISEINEIISDIAALIQKRFNDSQRNLVNVPVGSFSGITMFSGTGPRVKMRMVLLGNVDTDLRSEFSSCGINQTLHRVYLQINCNVGVLSAYKNLDTKVSNQVLLVENIVVGQIPSTYYNLEEKGGKGDVHETDKIGILGTDTGILWNEECP